MGDKKASAKSKVEAILFYVGHKISLEEIGKLSRSGKEEVLEALKELQAEYEQKQSSLMLFEEGDSWKFAVRDHLISVVRKIVTETELTKSVMETFAVIAFKYPVLQADLIKMRTNKAYDHLAELEKSGYISRQKHGRTNLIKLTEKFFKYFDLTEEKLREQFRDFDSIAKAIKEKEAEVDEIKEKQRKSAEELKQQDEKIKKEIESLDKIDEEFKIPVETYDVSAPLQQDISKDEPIQKENKMGDLEIVKIPKDERHKEIRKKAEDELKVPEPQEKLIGNPDEKPAILEDVPKPAPTENISEEIQIHKAPKTNWPKKIRKHKGGIKVSPEMEKKVDERVEEIISGKDEEENKI